jgi:hypothetical protein
MAKPVQRMRLGKSLVQPIAFWLPTTLQSPSRASRRLIPPHSVLSPKRPSEATWCHLKALLTETYHRISGYFVAFKWAKMRPYFRTDETHKGPTKQDDPKLCDLPGFRTKWEKLKKSERGTLYYVMKNGDTSP